MWQLSKPKQKELDPFEELPFCTRCFQVGTAFEEGSDHENFCHMCGSQGTCIPVKRKYIKELSDRVYEAMRDWRNRGFEQGTDLQPGDTFIANDNTIKVLRVNRSVFNWKVHGSDARTYDYTKIKTFTRELNGQCNFDRPAKRKGE